MERKCGACIECCVVLDDGDRKAFTPCSLLKKDGPGCSKYGERPDVCKTFRCTWLLGWTRPADRPDTSGVLAHLALNPMAEQIALNLVECRPGAFTRQKKLVDHYKQEAKVCCITLLHHDGHSSIYSRDQRFINLLREKNQCLKQYVPEDAEAIELVLEGQ